MKKIFIIVLTIVMMFGANAFAAPDGESVDIYLNGEKISTDGMAVMEDGCTFVKLRDLCELLGFRVEWDAAGGCVKMYYPGESSAEEDGICHACGSRFHPEHPVSTEPIPDPVIPKY